MKTRLLTARRYNLSQCRANCRQNRIRSAGRCTDRYRILCWAAVLLGLVALLPPGVTQAQSYSIDWHKISGGGGTSTGGVYSVSGTIGQHDAGAPMTGGNYSLTGGFWALYAVQTPGAPRLTIYLTATNTAVVWWPSPSSGWNLQVNTNLGTTNWIAPSETVTDDGTHRFIVVSPPSSNRFFRLLRP